MTLKEAIAAAVPTSSGDRFAIAEPFPDVSFIAAYWKHNDGIRVRGFQWDSANRMNREIIKEWDVEHPERMTVPFAPLAR